MKQTYTIFSLVLFCSILISYSGGRDDEFAGAPGDFGTCASCHGGGSATGDVILSNVPNFFKAGQTYSLTLKINHTSARVGGFQIVATNGVSNTMVGSFSAPSGTHINNVNRLTHSFPKSFSSGNTSWTFNWTAPATNPPANVIFFYAGNAADANGSTDGDVIFTGNTNSIVPIELVNFEAKQDNNQRVNLSWTTASETNNNVFYIERSLNNQKFETIGQVKGQGTTGQTHCYQFTDDVTSLQKTVAYYRLQQMDFDGHKSFSKTVSVALKSLIGLKIYPSLVTKGDIIHFEITGNIHFDIIDMNGKVVKTVQNTASSELFNMSTAELPAGRYFVRLLDKGMLQTAGFMVL